MKTPDHTPACRESPHVCICSHTRTPSLVVDGEVTDYRAIHPGVVTMDNITVDPMYAELFKNPVAIDSLDAGPGGRAGSIILPGGWSVPRENFYTAPEPVPVPAFPPIPRGGIKYPALSEAEIKKRAYLKVVAELNAAEDSKRFWRRCTIVLAALAVIGNAATYADWMGWI